MSSVRQQIVDAVETLVKAISNGGTVTVNGAVHTYSFTPATVDQWRVAVLGDEELPAVNIRDEDANVDGDAEIGRQRHVMQLTLAVGDASGTSLTDIRNRMQDLAAAIGSDPTIGGLAHRTRLVGHNIDTEKSNKRQTVGAVTFNIEYRTNPYSL